MSKKQKTDWIKLGEGPDPDFKKPYAIWIETKDEEGWMRAFLREINHVEGEKKYIFRNENNSIEWDSATHYLPILEPISKPTE